MTGISTIRSPGCGWKQQDFRALTLRLRDFAEKRCNGRIVSLLEGGYRPEDLEAASPRMPGRWPTPDRPDSKLFPQMARFAHAFVQNGCEHGSQWMWGVVE